MPTLLLFDVNETLLDLSSLDAVFRRQFPAEDAATLRRSWFSTLLELFLTATIVDRYRPFGELADDALAILCRQHGREASAADHEGLRTAMTQLTPHQDVPGALARLRDGGYRLAALTNSTAAAATALLTRTGLAPLFERILSADAVRRYKPAPESYAYAVRELGVAPSGILMVAAHDWDIAGALAAGLQGAFIARPGKALGPGQAQPAYHVRDIAELADRVLAGDAR